MSTYNGWTVVTIPSTPAFPKSLEFQINALTDANTNPFTGQQQLLSWNSGYYTGSVSYAPMTFAQAQDWVTFLVSLNGMANVFQFPTAVNTAFPLETAGIQANSYWRLKGNTPKWSIGEGQIYMLTFEVREAI